jgi:NAD(P)-dependent dehydrogenase (short-subunit alcohol dehydrogenase family)
MSYSSKKDRFKLNGKTALITGGAGVLGKHFCIGLAEYGANIAIVDINLDIANSLADEIEKKFKVKSKGFYCDVSDYNSVQLMVEEVVNYFKEINILLNNAAGKSNNLDDFFAPFEDYKLSQWKKIMSINIDGVFLVAQAVGKQMVRQGKGGSIIQTSSIYGVLSPDHRIYEGSFYLGTKINSPAVYAASKSAVIGLTKYLATYWADKGIRVNCISPGGVQSGQNDEFVKNYSNRVPLNRMADPDEMVGAIIYLASEASSYVTGQNLLIDGGLSSW